MFNGYCIRTFYHYPCLKFSVRIGPLSLCIICTLRRQSCHCCNYYIIGKTKTSSSYKTRSRCVRAGLSRDYAFAHITCQSTSSRSCPLTTTTTTTTTTYKVPVSTSGLPPQVNHPYACLVAAKAERDLESEHLYPIYRPIKCQTMVSQGRSKAPSQDSPRQYSRHY